MRKIYKNKNGNMSIEEFIKLIHKGKLENYMKNFKLQDDPCPPTELIAIDNQCFFCVSCQEHCAKQVKEYKEHYKVRNKKYPKEEFDDKSN